MSSSTSSNKERIDLMDPDQITIAEALLQAGAVQFGEFILTSGRKSDYYVNLKAALAEPKLLKQVADAIYSRIPEETGCVAGMELGAVPIAVAAGLRANLPYALIRKSKRAHGTGSRIEGVLSQQVVVVEDVATSGGSLIDAIEVLEGHDCEIKAIIVVVDREEGAVKAIGLKNYKLQPILTISQINSIKKISIGKGQARR